MMIVFHIVCIHEYFANLDEIEYKSGRFMDEVGYDTLIEIGMPTKNEIVRYKDERNEYVQEIKEHFRTISDKIIDGKYHDKYTPTATTTKRIITKMDDISTKSHHKTVQEQGRKKKDTNKESYKDDKYDSDDIDDDKERKKMLSKRIAKKIKEKERNRLKEQNKRKISRKKLDTRSYLAIPSSSSSTSSSSAGSSSNMSKSNVSDSSSESDNESESSSTSTTSSSVIKYVKRRSRSKHRKPKSDNKYTRIPGTNDPNYPPSIGPYRDKYWIQRGLRAASSDRKVIRRSRLDQSVKWKGNDSNFPAYEHTIEGWMDQNGMGYMNRPEFVKAYRQYGWKEARFIAISISTEQFQLDNEILFGALRSSAQQRGIRYVEKYLDTRDGLAVWLKFKDVFGGDNNLSLKIGRLQSELDKPYTDDYPGGFVAYIENIAYVFSRMDILDPTNTYHKYSKQKQCDTIRENFAGDHNYQHITYQYYDEMEQNKSFDMDVYIDRLTKYYQHNERAFNRKISRAQKGKSDRQEKQDDHNDNTTEFGDLERAMVKAYNLYQQQRRQVRIIEVPNQFFNLFKDKDPELLEQIMQLRQKAEKRAAELRGKTDTGNNDKIDITKPQYDRRNAKTSYQLEDAIVDGLTESDCDEGSIDTTNTDTDNTITPEECQQAIAFINKMRSESKRHAKCGRTIHLNDIMTRAMRLTTHHTESIIDGGADTMILGTGWLFMKIYPHRSIQVVGFDETKTKRGCRVGTACTVMYDVNDRPFLMIAHEAIKNEGSQTSLLSETQMRHNGLIVDSISEKHIGIDNKPGTQSIYSDDKEIQFRLQQKAGLMCITHRAPTEEEIKTLPRFTLTSEDIWNPSLLHDDDEIVDPYENTPFTSIAAHAYKDDETSTIATDFKDDEKVDIAVPHEFDPCHRPTNPLPHYRQAAKILEQYSIVNDKMAQALATDDTSNWNSVLISEPQANNEVNKMSACFSENTNHYEADTKFETSDWEFRVLAKPDERAAKIACSTQNTSTIDDHEIDTKLDITSHPYNLNGTIDDFIHSLSDRELLGYNLPHNSFAYHVDSCL